MTPLEIPLPLAQKIQAKIFRQKGFEWFRASSGSNRLDWKDIQTLLPPATGKPSIYYKYELYGDGTSSKMPNIHTTRILKDLTDKRLLLLQLTDKNTQWEEWNWRVLFSKEDIEGRSDILTELL